MTQGIVGTTVSESIDNAVAGETFSRATPDPASFIDGVAVVWNPTITEVATGRFLYTYVPTIEGAHAWYGNGSLSGPVKIGFDVITAAQADPIAYLIANSVTAVTVVSPTLANGSIAGIVRGDDYTAANGTSIPLTLADKTIPGGASVVYTVYHGPNSVALVKALTITAAGPPAILTLELSRHDTLRLPVGVSQTTIVQTTSGGAVTTLVEGTITVVTVPSG